MWGSVWQAWWSCAEMVKPQANEACSGGQKAMVGNERNPQCMVPLPCVQVVWQRVLVPVLSLSCRCSVCGRTQAAVRCVTLNVQCQNAQASRG